MKRPIIPLAAMLIAGILAGRWWTVSPVPLFVVTFALLAVAAASARVRPLLIWPLVLLVGWLDMAGRANNSDPYALEKLLPHPDRALLQGRLTATPQRHARVENGREFRSTVAPLDVAAFSFDGQVWQPATGRVMTRTSGTLPENYFCGQTVRVEGDVAPPERSVAEGLFDYAAYLREQDIHFVLRAKSPEQWKVIESAARPTWSERFDKWAGDTLALGLPAKDEALALECALTLGRRAALSEDVFEPYIRAGTYHIFAVDGLRIAIVSGVLIALLRVCALPRWACGILATIVIVAYAGLTGWPPSAMRAIVMAAVVFGGWCLGRPRDLLNSLALAAILILLWEPRQLFQPGFQLSVGVVLCILLVMPLFEAAGERMWPVDPLLPDELRPGWHKAMRWGARVVIGLFMTSLAAWLGSLPLVAYYFHLVSPVSGLSNVFAVPLCAVVLISNLASLLVGAWFPWCAGLFNHAGWFLMRCIEATSRWSKDLPGAYYYVPAPGIFTICVYYVVVLAALTGWLFRGKWRAWRIAGVAALALAWCAIEFQRSKMTCVTILPLGAGHAVYVQPPRFGADWLADCGDASHVESVTGPFLRAQGVNRLSNFILTHGQNAYNGGAEMADQMFEPGNIFASAIVSRSPPYRVFQRAPHPRSEWRAPVKAGDTAGPWTVLHPGVDDHFPETEDNAVVLRGEFGGVGVLLLSDLGRAGQRALLERAGNLRAEIVVAATPGDGEPLGDMLLEQIQPRLVVIADSERPAIRRTGKGFKERLARRNIPVIYESELGAVTLELQNGDWTLRDRDGERFSSREVSRRFTPVAPAPAQPVTIDEAGDEDAANAPQPPGADR